MARPFEFPSEQEQASQRPIRRGEEVFTFDYKKGSIDLRKGHFEEATEELFSMYADRPNSTAESVEFWILRSIGEGLIRSLQIKNLEDLHDKPVWKQIVQVVKSKIEELWAAREKKDERH